MRNLEGPSGDLTRAVLAYRHHDTALKLLLEPWGELVRRGDGRARSTIYTLGADTGRMSSVRFNFQQVSREGGHRACITADPGYLLASADFAGVELRVAGALSGDRTLIEIMADPTRDLHWEVARLAFGPDATKSQRYAIKRGVFGRIYGGGVKAVAAGVGVTIPVAQQVIDAMDALTPQLAEWSRMVRDGIEAGRTQFPTAAGRVIHLPKMAPHAGPNYCIQGTARELLIDALMRWNQTRWGDSVLLPVHDELVVMVPEDEAEAATTALVECMTTELAGVPIIAEASSPAFAWQDSV
jgi:DNA polymerase I-like protein with 3'-5' exonuclease and polymerase domains